MAKQLLLLITLMVILFLTGCKKPPISGCEVGAKLGHICKVHAECKICKRHSVLCDTHEFACTDCAKILVGKCTAHTVESKKKRHQEEYERSKKKSKKDVDGVSGASSKK